MATPGEPWASRPHMPGYGILGPEEGSGLIPWSVAQERLTGSRNYWVVTVWPDGRPQAMPVWGIWLDRALWFSSSLQSRRVRNLQLDPRCVVATQDADNPVVLEGTARVERAEKNIAVFLAALNQKYDTDYPMSFLDPEVNATVRVRPHRAFSLTQEDFAGSPTRWTFDPR